MFLSVHLRGMNNDRAAQVGEAEIPKIGLGTWQNTGEQCARSVKTTLETGYRHIGTTQMYDNEQQVGDGIEAAGVGRKEVFLTTKAWRSNLRGQDVRRQFTRASTDSTPSISTCC